MTDETITPIAPFVQAYRRLTQPQFERVKCLCRAVSLDEQFLWLDLLCETGAMSHAEAWEIIAEEILPVGDGADDE